MLIKHVILVYFLSLSLSATCKDLIPLETLSKIETLENATLRNSVIVKQLVDTDTMLMIEGIITSDMSSFFEFYKKKISAQLESVIDVLQPKENAPFFASNVQLKLNGRIADNKKENFKKLITENILSVRFSYSLPLDANLDSLVNFRQSLKLDIFLALASHFTQNIVISGDNLLDESVDSPILFETPKLEERTLEGILAYLVNSIK